MPGVEDRVVYKRTDGVWINKKMNSQIISSMHNSKEEAVRTATAMLKKTGGKLVTSGNEEMKMVKEPVGNYH